MAVFERLLRRVRRIFWCRWRTDRGCLFRGSGEGD